MTMESRSARSGGTTRGNRSLPSCSSPVSSTTQATGDASAVTTVVWVTATFVTAPTDRSTLVAFYKLVRPAGPGWESIRQEAAVGASPDSIAHALLAWVLGCFAVYAALFGAGSFLYGRAAQGIAWAAVFVVSVAGLLRFRKSTLG